MCGLHLIAPETEHRPRTNVLRTCSGPWTFEYDTPTKDQRKSGDPLR